jgi:hypothetical protein
VVPDGPVAEVLGGKEPWGPVAGETLFETVHIAEPEVLVALQSWEEHLEGERLCAVAPFVGFLLSVAVFWDW